MDKTEKELTEQDERIEGLFPGCGDLASVELLPPLFRAFRARAIPRCALTCTPVLPTTSRTGWTGA